MNFDYDHYNREERYLCAHLFRLLHEPVNGYASLKQFLRRNDVGGFKIFAEVALIRDAYFTRRDYPIVFMDDLVARVMKHEGLTEVTSYSGLPSDLRTPSLTHPREIRLKGGHRLTPADLRVYGAIQGMFNAKPDLAVCVSSELIVYEAKFTLGFDAVQLARTRNIADIWANLLYGDLGFTKAPEVCVRTLGLAKYHPDVSWEEVAEIAESVYPEADRTRRALRNAVVNVS
jgi:hypothetical protein